MGGEESFIIDSSSGGSEGTLGWKIVVASVSIGTRAGGCQLSAAPKLELARAVAQSVKHGDIARS